MQQGYILELFPQIVSIIPTKLKKEGQLLLSSFLKNELESFRGYYQILLLFLNRMLLSSYWGIYRSRMVCRSSSVFAGRLNRQPKATSGAISPMETICR